MDKRLHNTEEVKKLYDNTRVCSKPGVSDDQLMDWVSDIQQANAVDLVALTSRLSSGEEKESRNLKALREAVISEIERKNTQNIVETMKRLDATGTKLTWASVILAFIGVVFTVFQVVKAFVN